MSLAVRLHDAAPSGGRRELSADMRLSEFYREYYAPVHLLSKDSSPRNYEEIGTSVAYWVRFTGDPPLREIDEWKCRDFVVGLKDLPGKRQTKASNNTVRKHCGAIQAMLDLCGPQAPRRRDAVDILPRVPFITRPKPQKKPAEDCFTIAEIEKLLANADAARLPQGLACSPATYMRRLYLLIFNTGLRVGSACQACWGHYHGDHLLLPPEIIKGNDWKRIELNAAAQSIIESMRGVDAIRIFPWPFDWAGSRKQLYDQHKLVRECLPPERRFAFHGIRKLTNMELARLNPKACEKALGHASGKVNVDSYVSRTLVAETVAKLRQPTYSPSKQKKLFDV